MKIEHHGLIIDLDDAWWAEAEMENFVPSANTYRVDFSVVSLANVFEVSFAEVKSGQRNPGIGIFNSNRHKSAKDRVVSLLQGFRENSAIPPIAVLSEVPGSKFRFRIANGYHRFYCSLAAGYSRVPAMFGFNADA